MLALIILAQTTAAATAGVAGPDKAKATVRIVRPAPASAERWKETPPERRREIVRKAADGRIELLRIIEHP